MNRPLVATLVSFAIVALVTSIAVYPPPESPGEDYCEGLLAGRARPLDDGTGDWIRFVNRGAHGHREGRVRRTEAERALAGAISGESRERLSLSEDPTLDEVHAAVERDPRARALDSLVERLRTPVLARPAYWIEIVFFTLLSFAVVVGRSLFARRESDPGWGGAWRMALGGALLHGLILAPFLLGYESRVFDLHFQEEGYLYYIFFYLFESPVLLLTVLCGLQPGSALSLLAFGTLFYGGVGASLERLARRLEPGPIG